MMPTRRLPTRTLRAVPAALTVLVLGHGCAGTARLDRHHPSPPPAVVATADSSDLDRLKSLAGTWNADLDEDGTPDATVSYVVTANGSAVMERQFEGHPYEMVSVYHLDGDRLMLTHYCAATNQPRMVAIDIEPDAIEFDLLDITNLASPDGMHIHAARIEFVDADHVRSTWTHWDGGVPGEPLTFVMTRRP